VEKRDGKWQPAPETPEQAHERKEKLEREFPAKGDATCFNSALLRIKLLDPRTLAAGEVLADWQIYKALHSAIQKRGYGRVPWAARELGAKKLTPEEIEKEEQKLDAALAKADPAYKAAVEAWPKFKEQVPDKAFHFPCYYDARAMKLWSPDSPTTLLPRIDCTAESTRRVRFDRDDVEKEIAALANRAAEMLPALREAFARWQHEGCTVEWREELLRPVLQFGKTKSGQHANAFEVKAKDFAAFLVHGPAGEPSAEAREDFAGYLAFRTKRGVHPGSADDWLGATGQKTPRFDNRILNDCALISRLHVCGVGVRFDKATGKPTRDSLLASEVTFLMKLKNTLVEEPRKQRKLTPKEVQGIFKVVSAEALAVKPEEKNAEQKVTSSYAITKTAWQKKKGIKELTLRPLKGHEEIKAPKSEGRSRFSRPALRLVRALILSGQKPSVFHARLLAREKALLDEIGTDVLDAEPARFTGENGQEKKFVKQPRPWVLASDLKFLADLARTNDTWEDLHFPEQRLDALEARHTGDDETVNVPAAVRELLGSINDPVVRHRLGVFAERLTKHHSTYGMPQEVVLEFVREDFMGEDAKRDLAKFQKQREDDRKKAKERAAELGITERSGRLKYELFHSQGGECLYCQQPMKETELANYRIEHIVPRAQGGADAMVNYVLAHEKCNDEKGEKTPFQWKHGREGWDAYETCVQRHATALRNKKVQLLLRADAPELVQRYTALAETAWISRHAQKIVSLHFGWRNGNDKDGNKRVTVISGGFTARIRRRYRLNSLLNPMKPEWFDEQWAKATKGLPLSAEGEQKLREMIQLEWESAAEKNRKDKRHHALDAMVINFWNTGTKKQDAHYFRFPEALQKNPCGIFEKHIAQVTPENEAFEKAILAETIYGGRTEDGKTTIVQRIPLLDLGMESVGQNKTAFSARFLRKKLKKLRESQSNAVIEQQILDWLDDDRDEAEWRMFCENLRLPRRDGSPGPRVKRVTVKVGNADEYAEISKDQTGAYRKGKEEHKGQLIYWDDSGQLQIRPVYAHGSPAAERRKIEALGGKAKFYGFFRAGCTVQLEREVPSDKYSLITRNEAKQLRRLKPTEPLAAGAHLLGTISAKNHDVVLERANGTRVASPLKNLIDAGMTRSTK
jgi:CRISPR-associated endonuclease Csn1